MDCCSLLFARVGTNSNQHVRNVEKEEGDDRSSGRKRKSYCWTVLRSYSYYSIDAITSSTFFHQVAHLTVIINWVTARKKRKPTVQCFIEFKQSRVIKKLAHHVRAITRWITPRDQSITRKKQRNLTRKINQTQTMAVYNPYSSGWSVALRRISHSAMTSGASSMSAIVTQLFSPPSHISSYSTQRSVWLKRSFAICWTT